MDEGGTKYGASVKEIKEGREEEEEEDHERGEEKDVTNECSSDNNIHTGSMKVYKRRFWILTLYSALCFVHVSSGFTVYS